MCISTEESWKVKWKTKDTGLIFFFFSFVKNKSERVNKFPASVFAHSPRILGGPKTNLHLAHLLTMSAPSLRTADYFATQFWRMRCGFGLSFVSPFLHGDGMGEVSLLLLLVFFFSSFNAVTVSSADFNEKTATKNSHEETSRRTVPKDRHGGLWHHVIHLDKHLKANLVFFFPSTSQKMPKLRYAE